jgi:hypothetical protein
MTKLFSALGTILAVSVLLFVSNSCVKQDFDEPPIKYVPIGEVLTIGDLRQIHADSSGEYVFTSDYSVYGTVVMGEATGNIYQSVYMQDTSGGINVYFKETSELQYGDMIRIYLNGAMVSDYNDLIQISEIQLDQDVFINANGNYITPRTVTIKELIDAMDGGYFDEYESTLVRFDSVQFSLGDIGKTYAEPEAAGERFLEDCNFNSIMVRTSNYASFKDSIIPEGRGSFVAIAGQYQGTIQLIIRSTLEVELFGPRCGGSSGGVTEIDEDFSDHEDYDPINIEGWLNVATVGSRNWQAKEFQGNIYAQATSFGNSNFDDENVCWMITPGIDLDAMTNPKAEFLTAQAYWKHDGLEVLVSTDFNGANISGATWTALPCTIAGQGDDNYDWVESGEIDLSSYSGELYIAFKYSGKKPEGETTSYIVDDVKVWDAGK